MGRYQPGSRVSLYDEDEVIEATVIGTIPGLGFAGIRHLGGLSWDLRECYERTVAQRDDGTIEVEPHVSFLPVTEGH